MGRWYLWNPDGVHSLSRLELAQVPEHKGHGAVKNLAQRAGKFLGIEIHTPMNVVAGIANSFDDELRFDSFGYPLKAGHLGIGQVR
jgi:hypothetical protein